MTRINGTLLDDQNAFMIICLIILVRMRNVSGKAVEKIKTHFVFINFENRAVYEICGKIL
jgi:hypothetical protein